jgi:ATP-binding protein involved in chromosome partitioning
VRVGGDSGLPVVASDPSRPASAALTDLARALGERRRSLAGRKLNLTPVG